jgi:RNA polymerase sigma-70 factor (ECF subfamily)
MGIGRAIDPPWSGAYQPDWKVAVTRDRGEDGRPATSDLEADASLGDASLVAACLAGNREAFDAIVRRHQRQVYQLCYRFAGNHEDASDLTQDAFIRAYRGLGSFKGSSAFSTWLYRVAVNVCLNRVGARARKPLVPLDAADRLDSRIERADTLLLKGERAAELRAAIARLPRKQRAALILRVYHELPHEQIAEILGSSVGAVKANFFHALANLRKLLRVQS